VSSANPDRSANPANADGTSPLPTLAAQSRRNAHTTVAIGVPIAAIT
jgi:hypothetical protein